jgi:hypothetical protein
MLLLRPLDNVRKNNSLGKGTCVSLRPPWAINWYTDLSARVQNHLIIITHVFALFLARSKTQSERVMSFLCFLEKIGMRKDETFLLCVSLRSRETIGKQSAWNFTPCVSLVPLGDSIHEHSLDAITMCLSPASGNAGQMET